VANDVTRQNGDRVLSPRSMARSPEISESDLGIIQEAGVKQQRINVFTCSEEIRLINIYPIRLCMRRTENTTNRCLSKSNKHQKALHDELGRGILDFGVKITRSARKRLSRAKGPSPFHSWLSFSSSGSVTPCGGTSRDGVG